MTKRVRWVLVGLALAGLAASVSSLYVHVRLLNQPGYTSFCDVNTTVSCTQVYQSQYSTVGGVPVALFGTLWFVAVLLMLGGSIWGWQTLRANALDYVLLMGLPALVPVVGLAYVSLAILKTVCAMCVATYIAVTGIVVVAALARTSRMHDLPGRLRRDWSVAVASPVAMTVLMIFIMGATLAIAFVPRHGAAKAAGPATGKGDPKAEFAKFWEAQPRTEIPIATGGASVVVIKFSDFMCPGCAESYVDHKPILAKYAARYPGEFTFIMEDYPLERECNPTVPVDKHEAACEAAVAVRLARTRGTAPALEDWLYARNQALTPDSVRQAARDVGGIPDYDAQYRKTIDEIKRDIAAASTVGINQTPTFFFGHKEPGSSVVRYVRAEGALLPEYFELAIQYELTKAGKSLR